MFQVFNAETQRRRVRREILELESGWLDGRVEHVERVEMFMQDSRPHSLIMDSGSSIERSHLPYKSAVHLCPETSSSSWGRSSSPIHFLHVLSY